MFQIVTQHFNYYITLLTV